MCIIQATEFTLNGSSTVPNCTASGTDNIGFDGVVTFTAAEAGKSYNCWFNLKLPTGVTRQVFVSLVNIPSAGTYDFIKSNIITAIDPKGAYNITACSIYDSTNVTIICSTTVPVVNCVPLTVTAPTICPTLKVTVN